MYRLTRKQTSSRWFRGSWKILLFLLWLPYALAVPYYFFPPPSTMMIGRMLILKHVERTWLPLERISPNLIEAVVTSEDDAFCDHSGFDFRQMQKSIVQAQASGRPVKATSTISMQTAKNLFLWGGRSWTRKILETPLTAWLELLWPKKRILEVYLNVAEWGDGVYGAEAAARHHFGVSASNLTRQQAALLAAALPNPIKRNAGHPGTGILMIAASINRRLAKGGPDLTCLKDDDAK